MCVGPGSIHPRVGHRQHRLGAARPGRDMDRRQPCKRGPTCLDDSVSLGQKELVQEEWTADGRTF